MIKDWAIICWQCKKAKIEITNELMEKITKFILNLYFPPYEYEYDMDIVEEKIHKNITKELTFVKEDFINLYLDEMKFVKIKMNDIYVKEQKINNFSLLWHMEELLSVITFSWFIGNEKKWLRNYRNKKKNEDYK